MEKALTPEQALQVLDAVNKLELKAMVFLILIACIVLYYIFAKRKADRADRAQSEENKNARALRYTDSLANLTQAVTSMAKAEAESRLLMTDTLSEVKDTMDRLNKTVTGLADKADGRINEHDSARIIRDRFVIVIFRGFCGIIERSLTENDYQNRKDFVKRKVKTAMGEVMSESLKYLQGYNLTIDVHKYFVVEGIDAKTRFLLVSTVWSNIEFLFLDHQRPLNDRIEEAFLLTENTVSDYVNACSAGSSSVLLRVDALSQTDILKQRSTRLLEKP